MDIPPPVHKASLVLAPVPDGKPFICPDCDFSTANKGSLTRHTKSTACRRRVLELADARARNDVTSKDKRAPAKAPRGPAKGVRIDVVSSDDDDDDDDDDDAAPSSHSADDNVPASESDAEKDRRVFPNRVIDRLTRAMNITQEAVAYQQPHNELKRRYNAINDILAQTKATLVRAQHEEKESGERLHAAARDLKTASDNVALASAGTHTVRAELAQRSSERDALAQQHASLADVNGTLARHLEVHLEALAAQLPEGVGIAHALGAHYTDEHGIVDAARMEAFIDRVAPNLRASLARAEAAVQAAQRECDRRAAVVAELVSAEGAAAKRRDEATAMGVACAASVARLTALMDYFTGERAAVVAREKAEFLDHERDNTGTFGGLSYNARALVLQMRAHPDLVKDIGNLAGAISADLPRAMVSATPFVLNSAVLARTDAAHTAAPPSGICTLCAGALADEEKQRASPLVRTPCNHVYHAACLNALYCKDRAHYDTVFRQDIATEIPCPQCQTPVPNTALALVAPARYFF